MTSYIKKIGNRGELVIPKSIRKSEGLTENTKVRVFKANGAIVLVPIKKSFRDLAGLFGKGGVDHKRLDEIMFEAMATT